MIHLGENYGESKGSGEGRKETEIRAEPGGFFVVTNCTRGGFLVYFFLTTNCLQLGSQDTS